MTRPCLPGDLRCTQCGARREDMMRTRCAACLEKVRAAYMRDRERRLAYKRAYDRGDL